VQRMKAPIIASTISSEATYQATRVTATGSATVAANLLTQCSPAAKAATPSL
jgi:hypothetical protein